jgi:hypothetical protein
MFKTLTEFTEAYGKSKQRGNQGGPVTADKAYLIYMRTYDNPLRGLVLGRHTDRDGKTTPAGRDIPASGGYRAGAGINWFGDGGLIPDKNSPTLVAGAPDFVAQNFGVTSEVDFEGKKFTGGILGAAEWDYAVNDTWVLAGLHRKMPFWCASALTKDNLISVRRDEITITGREVLALLAFGYKKVSGHVELGVGFECENDDIAEAANFVQYDAIGERYAKGKDALEFFNKCGLGI